MAEEEKPEDPKKDTKRSSIQNALTHLGSKLPIYVLVIVISALAFFYSLVYIPKNEADLNAHANRLLHNKAISIAEKYRGYNNAINSAVLTYFSKWFFKVYPNDSVRVFKVNDKYYFTRNEQKWSPQQVHCALSRASCIAKGSGKLRYREKLITRSAFKSSTRADKSLEPELHGPVSGDGRIVWKSRPGHYFFVLTPKSEFFDMDSVDSKNKEYCKPVRPYMWVNAANFTSNLKENDFFDDVFLVREPALKDAKTYDFQDEVTGRDGHVIDKSRLGLVRFSMPDSAIMTGTGMFKRNVGGSSYRAYYKLVSLERELKVYVVGLVSKDNFDKESRLVPLWFLTFCGLAMLMLVFLFPVLKIFILNEHDRMTASDTRLSVLSVILCVCLLVTLLVGGYFFWGVESNEVDKRLRTLADSIKTNTNRDVAALKKSLSGDLFSHGANNAQEFRSKNANLRFNEVFSVDRNGNIKSIFTDRGQQIDTRKFPISVQDRNYYRGLSEGAPGGDSSIVESISSFASGQREVAVSTRKKNESDTSIISVVTSRLPSLINAILPVPMEFVVIDRKGKINFVSGNSELKSENFFEECNNDLILRTHVENNISGFLDFNYLRRDCRGYLTPLQEKWYLMVYYPSFVRRNLAAHVFSLCLISMAFIILLCAFLHFLLRLDYPKPLLLKTKSYYYDWLNPRQCHVGTWWALALSNLILFVAEMRWLAAYESFVVSVFFVMTVISVSYLVNYTSLAIKKEGKWILSSVGTKIISWSRGKSYRAQMATVVVAIGLFVWTMGLTTSSILLLVLIFVPMFLIMPFARSMASKAGEASTRNFAAYRVFIASWILVIAIGPSWIFASEHYNYQSLVRTYAFLIKDVSKKLDAFPLGHDYEWKAEDENFEGLKRNTRDSRFYAFVPRYTSKEQAESGLLFNYVPNYRDYILGKSDDWARAEFHGTTRQRPILKLDLVFNSAVLIVIIISLAVAWLIAWALTAIPRKIFYSPDLDIWKSYPRSMVKENGPEREFEDSGESLPPPNKPSAATAKIVQAGPTRTATVGIDHPLKGHPISPIMNSNYDLYLRFMEESDELKSFTKRRLAKEKYILGLQAESEEVYAKIWKGVGKKGRAFLYDLSQDGVTNLSDHRLIGDLAAKGLLRLDPKLEIVNKSFANYASENLSPDEKAEIENDEGTLGRWQTTKAVLIILIIAVFAFLTVAEEGFLGRATAILGSITVFAPSLVNAIGSVTKFFK